MDGGSTQVSSAPSFLRHSRNSASGCFTIKEENKNALFRKKAAVEMWAREIASSGTGMAPGLCGMVGGRPKATPCLRLHSFLYPKDKVERL